MDPSRREDMTLYANNVHQILHDSVLSTGIIPSDLVSVSAARVSLTQAQELTKTKFFVETFVQSYYDTVITPSTIAPHDQSISYTFFLLNVIFDFHKTLLNFQPQGQM